MTYDVKVIDGICGAGKTTKIFDLINELSTPITYGSPPPEQFIFVTPFLMECHRVAGTIPIEIPIEHADSFPGLEASPKSEKDCDLEPRRDENHKIIYRDEKPTSRNFVIPPKLGGKRIDGIRDAIYHYHDIVITHKAFTLFNQDIVNLLKERPNYQLIVDEVPQVFGLITDLAENISQADIESFTRTGNLTVDDHDNVKWETTDAISRLDRYEDLIRYCDESRVIRYNERGSSMLFLRQIPETFKGFKSVHLLTYLFDGSICKSYFDLYNITYQIEHIHKNVGDSIKYWELIRFYEPRDANILSLRNSALSKSWYVRNMNELDFLKTAISNFFNNGDRTILLKERLWTVFKGTGDHGNIRTALEGKGYKKRFLPLNSRATNSFRHVKQMAYLVNLYPNAPIANYFSSKGFTIERDKYALGEMIQWIFRGQIRDGLPIVIFIPSNRMKGLLQRWMQDLKVECES